MPRLSEVAIRRADGNERDREEVNEVDLRVTSGESARWLLLGTAVLQLMSPAVIGFDQSAAHDPPVVPPNYFFGIWW